MTSLKRFFKGFFPSIVLFPSVIVCNALQMTSLLVKPFSPRLFRRINRNIADTWWRWCDLWAEKINGTEIIFSGDELPLEENAIVILNHQALVDIPVAFRLARMKGRLGDMKWFVKDVLKYVPGIGWGMLFLDCLFLKRNWLKDQGSITRVFSNLTKFEVPCWIMSFVEGTRFSPKKIKASQEYAAKNGYQVMNHVQMPRTKGFVATATSLGNLVPAVYDFTIGYFGKVPTMIEWIRGDVQKAALHMRRFELKDLPKTEKELSDWLRQIFVEKDQLLERFYQSGSFV